MCLWAVSLSLLGSVLIGLGFILSKKQYKWIERQMLRSFLGYFPSQTDSQTNVSIKWYVGPALIGFLVLVGLIFNSIPIDIERGILSLSQIVVSTLIVCLGWFAGILLLIILSCFLPRPLRKWSWSSKNIFSISYWVTWVVSIALATVAIYMVPSVPRLVISFLAGFAVGIMIMEIILILSPKFKRFLTRRTYEKKPIASIGLSIFILGQLLNFICAVKA